MFESLPSPNGPLQNPSRQAKTAIRRLTRISHELSATVPDPSASARPLTRLIRREERTATRPARGTHRSSDGVSDSSRRKPVRKAGQPITEAVWMNPHIGLPSMCSMSTVWRRSFVTSEHVDSETIELTCTFDGADSQARRCERAYRNRDSVQYVETPPARQRDHGILPHREHPDGFDRGLDRRVAETRRDVASGLTGPASGGNP